ncbi:hypothetical protein, variant [Exophiala oligosperma]|uniref:Uncharacterized protein n=1 Tax=Exophiala oligosperma TaxID=215243 RepID=A0A0D2DA23_9EURO|nr:uncharacterized protein PV06_08519 [Exophiala oligosperma]XP_016260174.1 hypothetical protein, variant [Exophiala oligosperma]KIW39957.1 hypothetical protein PV06_08519 [Exophiala oligosperma]KIW39958.1 hypothetical protein, variant [Exophiala oligosperma]
MTTNRESIETSKPEPARQDTPTTSAAAAHRYFGLFFGDRKYHCQEVRETQEGGLMHTRLATVRSNIITKMHILPCLMLLPSSKTTEVVFCEFLYIYIIEQ